MLVVHSNKRIFEVYVADDSKIYSCFKCRYQSLESISFVAKRRSSPKVLFLQINFFSVFIYTVIELVKMSSSSNLQYEEIPKKYIDPLAPKDKGEGSRVNGKIGK